LFLVEAAQSLVLQHARVCVVSLGARGAVARAATGEAGSAAASKVAVVDTIGAGDLFSAGFLYALLRGSPLSTCCAAGCAAGAEAVQARGTALSGAAWRRLRATIAGLVGDNATGVAEGRPPPGSARALICPPGRKHRTVYGQQGSVGHSPGLERSRTGSLASSMTSSSSTQWLGMEADS
jgi:hypothetical protein